MFLCSIVLFAAISFASLSEATVVCLILLIWNEEILQYLLEMLECVKWYKNKRNQRIHISSNNPMYFSSITDYVILGIYHLTHFRYNQLMTKVSCVFFTMIEICETNNKCIAENNLLSWNVEFEIPRIYNGLQLRLNFWLKWVFYT